MKPIISVKNLSKKYQIREHQPYYSLRDSIVNLVKGPKGIKSEKDDFIWALKDISFDVYPGEVIGIIGSNGSGKSTLLKILSKITPPTSGTVTLEGRVASLLEVGTGFHPELTGRENIFLNGAILGMSRKEIKSKFDEIVDFAEIEKFLDTPVKHYSSGMYMRLAFAVAAHLESEILLVDEVLAVGDYEFQKKCLGKMIEVSKKGRTILFVSHNTDAIRQLCQKVILFKGGRILAHGDSNRIINLYLTPNIPKPYTGIKVHAKVLNSAGIWTPGDKLAINITWPKGRFGAKWECDLAFYTLQGVKLFALQSHLIPGIIKKENSSGILLIVKNPGLAPKDIYLDVGIKLFPNAPSYEALLENCLYITPSIKRYVPYVYNPINEGILIPDVKGREL